MANTYVGFYLPERHLLTVKTIVNKSGGVYTVLIDPMTRQSVRKDSPIAQSCIPSTMLKLEHVYQNFGEGNVEIVDFDPPPAEQKTVNVSDSEIAKYLESNNQFVPENTDTISLLNYFREGAASSKYNKAYINGMAHIILSLNPSLKDDLIKIATKKEKAKRTEIF